MLALFIPWGSDGEVFKTYDNFTKVWSIICRDKLSGKLLFHVKNFNLLMKSRGIVMEEESKKMEGNEFVEGDADDRNGWQRPLEQNLTNGEENIPMVNKVGYLKRNFGVAMKKIANPLKGMMRSTQGWKLLAEVACALESDDDVE